jgi:hypothetical protein
MEATQLIEYLQGVAASLEAETGALDPEIRAKIAQLQSALAQRDTTVRSEASKLATNEAADAAAEDVGASSAIRQASQQMAAVDSALSQVEHDLAENDDAKRFLAQSADMWLPAIRGAQREAPEGALVEGVEDMQE